ncbi:hypothetical protein FJTKL_02258 [Diaporthe vaccinii]|uniref:FAD-binding domain-containing protein n=1 Tax=Diaporthe vaccinii TaxID=105482 RepID=A0ABR4F3I2_9PEZI
MYPCREYELMNIAFAVPDGSLRDPDQLQYSWNAAGNKEDMVEALCGFPEWLQRMSRCASRVNLFQLRDQEPLPTYVKGRTVLIGDAAHAMVPYQGQGANQAFEDAEGLNAVLADVTERDQIPGLLRIGDSVRRPRASEVQKASRSSQTKIASKEASEAVSSVRPYTSMKEALALLQGNKLVV